jgi:cytochrome c oxidase subunit IV
VLPLGTKALFVMALVTLITSAVYGLATNDSTATTALGFVAVGAFVLGVVVIFADPDRAPWVAPDTPLAQQSPSGGRPQAASPWPLAGGLALGVLVIAAAADAVIVLTAAGVLTVVALGWFFQHWTEDESYTPRYGARLKERILLPIGLPVGVFALVAVIAISLSRVLLAVSEQGTRYVAFAVAAVVIISGFAIAASERMARTALALLCSFALLAAVGAGIAGMVHGERHFETPKTKPFHGSLPPGINPTVISTLGSKAGSAAATTTSTP